MRAKILLIIVLTIVCNFAFSQTKTIKGKVTSGQVEVSGRGSVSGESSTISLMTLTGIMIDRFNWDGKSARLDLSSHPRGVYILVIQTPEETEMKKIILK